MFRLIKPISSIQYQHQSLFLRFPYSYNHQHPRQTNSNVQRLTLLSACYHSQKGDPQKKDETVEKQQTPFKFFNHRIMEILYVDILRKNVKKDFTQFSHRRRTKKTSSSSNLFSFFKKVFWAILGGGTIFYAELQQALFTRLYEYLKKRLSENEQISKGKYVQAKIIQELQAEYKEYKQIVELFTDELSICPEIQNIIRQRNFKELLYVESYSGNCMGANLKRMISERMHIRPLMFQKFYYLNLKNSPVYEFSKNYEDQDWHEARELHYLMNALIDQKKKTAKPNVLVIDDLQALEHFFDSQEGQQIIESLVKQVYQLQKVRNTKIICICNSATFSQRLANVLRKHGKFDKFKHYFIDKLTPRDLMKIVSKRTQYKQLIELQLSKLSKPQSQAAENEAKFQAIMKTIFQNHDNLGEIFRILKSSGIDYKQYYLKNKNLKKQALLEVQNDAFFSYNPFVIEDYEYMEDVNDSQIPFQGHLPSLKFIQFKTLWVSDKIIQEKVQYIKKAISCSFRKNEAGRSLTKQNSVESIKRQKELQKAKLQILSKISQIGYANNLQRLDVSSLSKRFKINLQDHIVYKAYLELNYDNILHGLTFTDLATFRAFEKIKTIKQSKKKKRFFFF